MRLRTQSNHVFASALREMKSIRLPVSLLLSQYNCVWSRAFSFSRDGRELVLRLGCYQEDFLKDQKAMVFARTDLPILTVLDVGEAPGGTIVVNTARPEQDQ